MSFLPTLLITCLTISILLRYWGFPLLFRRLTQLRVSSFSLLSARGLEWRSSSQPNAVVPTLRVERAGWTWGGLRGEEMGLVILKLEGLSFRVKGKEAKSLVQREERPTFKVRSPFFLLAFLCLSCQSAVIRSKSMSPCVQCSSFSLEADEEIGNITRGMLSTLGRSWTEISETGLIQNSPLEDSLPTMAGCSQASCISSSITIRRSLASSPSR